MSASSFSSEIDSTVSNLSPRGLLNKMREHQDWHRKKQYLKSIADIFKNPQDLRANDKASLAIILKKMITKAIIDDFQQLNRLETSDI